MPQALEVFAVWVGFEILLDINAKLLRKLVGRGH